jgi:hypothetical protein
MIARPARLAGWIFAMLFAAAPALHAQPAPAPAAPETASRPAGWNVRLIQRDRIGVMVGEPHEFPCPQAGCQQVVTLDVLGKPRRFLVALTFIPRGAYLALQSLQPEINNVSEFDKGFEGPVFVKIQDRNTVRQTLSFNLAGSAMNDSSHNQPMAFNSNGSLVFHRKMDPDLVLNLELTPAPAASQRAGETKPGG